MNLSLPELTGTFALVITVIGLLLALAAVVRLRYKVVKPNTALIIAGSKKRRKHTGDQENTNSGSLSKGSLKVVQGGGVLVWPIFQRSFEIDLETMEISVDVKNVPSKNKVKINVDTTANIRIGDTIEDINAAATRFLSWDPEQIATNAQEILAGSLRSIIGTMTVEEIIEDREAFSEKVQEVASKELRPMGLVIDVMNVKEVTDDQDYVTNLGVADIERVRKAAEMVKVNTELEITQNRLAAEQQQAEKTRETEIKKAEFKAEQDSASMKAAQAGPLADAEARMAVVTKLTEVAALEAARKESELQTELIKPAEAAAQKTQIDADAAALKTEIDAAAAAKKTEIDAKAAATQTEVAAKARATQIEVEGKAQAAATQVTGEAEAAVATLAAKAEGAKVREVSTAKADGMAAEADALNKLSDASVKLKTLEVMPEIVGRAAQAVASIDGLYVSGESGVDHVLSFVPQMVSSGIAMATGNYQSPVKRATEPQATPVTTEVAEAVSEVTTTEASQEVPESVAKQPKAPVLDAESLLEEFGQTLSALDGSDLYEKLVGLREQGGQLLTMLAGDSNVDNLVALAESIEGDQPLDQQVVQLLALVNADPKLANVIVRLLPTLQTLVMKASS